MPDQKAVATAPGLPTQYINLTQAELDQRSTDAAEAAKLPKAEHLKAEFEAAVAEALANNTDAERASLYALVGQFRAAEEFGDPAGAREVVASATVPANLDTHKTNLLAILDNPADRW